LIISIDHEIFLNLQFTLIFVTATDIYIYICVKRDSLYEFEFGEYMDSRIYEGNSYTLIKVSNSLVT